MHRGSSASVMRFMCGQRLHGLTNSRSGNSAATLSLIEHSVISASDGGRVSRTWCTIPAVEPT